MKIVLVPEKVLLKKAKSVTDFGPKLANIVEDMKRTLNACVDPVGVGLAAPQVGLSLRIFLMKPTTESPIGVFINPEILSTGAVKPQKAQDKEDDDDLSNEENDHELEMDENERQRIKAEAIKRQ